MQFHVARTARVTGGMLHALVTAELAEVNVVPRNQDIHVCYGVGSTVSPHTLNGNCSRYSKAEQTRLLSEGLGPGGLQYLDAAAAVEHFRNSRTPLFARNLIHSRGTDIKPVLEAWQVGPLVAAGAGFFTAHEPSTHEYRTWVYRNRHLGTYEKVLRRPADCRRLGRNHANGFDFSGVENAAVPEALKEISRQALSILGLDFGAVDILRAPDGHFVVLEVNSAPGVSDDRRRVIVGLAHRIVRWVANGCPSRA